MKKRIFITLFIATMVTMLGLGIIDPILPLYAKSMHATGIELGIIFSGFAISRGIFAPIIGQFSDEHGRKKLIVSGLILFMILSICFVLASNPIALTIIRIAQGFSSVLVTPVTQAYIGDITPVGQEGKYMNLFFISFFGGQAIGPYLGGYLSDQYNMVVPFYAVAVLSAAALILVLFFVRESSFKKKSRKEETSSYKSLLSVFRNKSMRGIMAYMFSRGFYRWGFNAFFPVLAVKAAGISITNVGLILSAYMLSGALIQYPSGLAVDKYSSGKVGFVLVGGIISALVMFVIGYFHSFLLFMILTIIMGLFSSISRASAVAIRTEIGRDFGMGSVTGAFTTSASFGQVLGPLLFGIIADSFSIPTAFVLGGIVGLGGTIAASLYLKSSKNQTAKSI